MLAKSQPRIIVVFKRVPRHRARPPILANKAELVERLSIIISIKFAIGFRANH
jgi:hypothetical protein